MWFCEAVQVVLKTLHEGFSGAGSEPSVGGMDGCAVVLMLLKPKPELDSGVAEEVSIGGVWTRGVDVETPLKSNDNNLSKVFSLQCFHVHDIASKTPPPDNVLFLGTVVLFLFING